MRLVVLIPRRADGGRRDELWAWVRARWLLEHPELELVEGHCSAEVFNRSAAINLAAEEAGDWDLAVIADSDSFVGTWQLNRAIDRCLHTQQMTLAYDIFCYLSRAMSDQIMAGYTGDWHPGVEWSLPGSCSSMVIVTREVWDLAEGFDEGFVGWGGEDIAFSHKAQTFGGGLQRVRGPVWHLHHPPAVHADNGSWVPRIERYAEASYDRDKMRALMTELAHG